MNYELSNHELIARLTLDTLIINELQTYWNSSDCKNYELWTVQPWTDSRFLQESIVNEHHKVVGQYINYRIHLRKIDVERIPFLAITTKAYKKLQTLPPLLESFEECNIKLIIVDPEKRTIQSWIK